MKNFYFKFALKCGLIRIEILESEKRDWMDETFSFNEQISNGLDRIISLEKKEIKEYLGGEIKFDRIILPGVRYINILENSSDDKIYCHCVYEGRDIPKSLGFRGDPAIKLWYISKQEFTYETFIKSQVVRFGSFHYYYVYYCGKIDIEKRKKECLEEMEEVKEMKNKKILTLYFKKKPPHLSCY